MMCVVAVWSCSVGFFLLVLFGITYFNLSSLGRVFRIRLVLRLRQDAFAQELNKLAVVAGKSQVAGRLHGQLDYAPAVLAEHALMKQASMQ